MSSTSGSPQFEQSTLTRILRRARARRDLRDIPGAEAAFGDRAGRKPGLTQSEVAHLAGVTRGWYSRLETGKAENYSLRFLAAIGRILDLDADEWHIVQRLATDLISEHHHSAGLVAPSVTPSEAPNRNPSGKLPQALRTFVHQQKSVAYISDYYWNLLTYNSVALRHYPWMLHGGNIMEWVLTYPEARTQLIDWEQDWARPMMAQLRLHFDQRSTEPRMQEVVAAIRADPDARALWDAPDLPATSHPDINKPRRLYLPRYGKQVFEATLVTIGPLEDTSLRFMAVMTT